MSENLDILKRAFDLSGRSERQSTVTSTGFLTPAQQYVLLKNSVPGLYLFGGGENCERKIAFFLPFYLTPETFEPEEYIRAVKASAPFSSLSHRDYLGALLAQGIERESIGDIYVSGETAYFYVLPSVAGHILLSLDKIGRGGVKLKQVPLTEVRRPEARYREETFTVQSLRLDSVVSGAFRISRAQALKLIGEGLVSRNYEPCLKADTQLKEGDIISARGHGKFELGGGSGLSRKGRTFITVRIHI